MPDFILKLTCVFSVIQDCKQELQWRFRDGANEQ